MSNHLAIATVTAAVKHIIQTEVQKDFQEINVTVGRPQAPDKVKTLPCLNIYAYQATPNPAWKNADLRTRRPKAELTRHAQAALDIHYLFTCYGDDSHYVPEQLLGSTIRALIDRPLLTRDMIEASLDQDDASDLRNSSLIDQVQTVRLIQSEMTPDSIFRLWSTFFQVPYTLSFPYQASAVLIESERAGSAALPVRRRATNVFVGRPIIEDVQHIVNGRAEPRLDKVTIQSDLRLTGRDFGRGDHTRVQIGKTPIEAQRVSDSEIWVSLSELRLTEREQIRAGTSKIQVVRRAMTERPADEPENMEVSVKSNAVPIVLAPRVLSPGGLTVQQLTPTDEIDETRYDARVQVKLDLQPFPNQLVFLVLFGMSEGITGDTAIIRAMHRLAQTDEVIFELSKVKAGSYLVRVQVDGAESPLQVDERQQYSGPLLQLG